MKGRSNRAVSLHFAAVNACHSEGRYRMSRERALTKRTHEDENQRRPFLGLATPFSPDDSPLRGETTAPYALTEKSETKKERGRKNRDDKAVCHDLV